MTDNNFKTKTYIQWLMPGAFFSSSYSKEVVGERLPEIEDIDPRAYGFYFYQLSEYIAPDGEVLTGTPKNETGVYYIDGQVFTLKEIEEKLPTKKALICNMKVNKIKKVVMTNKDSFQFFEKQDRIFLTQGNNG